MPSMAQEYESVVPEYIEFDGWQEDVSKARKWHELPTSLRFYLGTISDILGIPVFIASVGAERESTIFAAGSEFLQNFMKD
jgi:adenylosuccinate synthase